MVVVHKFYILSIFDDFWRFWAFFAISDDFLAFFAIFDDFLAFLAIFSDFLEKITKIGVFGHL